MNTHDFGGLPADINADNGHENYGQDGIEKANCKPERNKQQGKGGAKGAWRFGRKPWAKTDTAKHNEAVLPAHLLKVNFRFMQNVDTHEIEQNNLRHSVKKLIPSSW